MYICGPRNTSECRMWPGYTWKLETPAIGHTMGDLTEINTDHAINHGHKMAEGQAVNFTLEISTLHFKYLLHTLKSLLYISKFFSKTEAQKHWMDIEFF
jgi:hypothetical protein